jgi:hypothetical protein
MSKQTINIGASPNDGTGTPLRTSFDYTNQNFTELYTALGGGVGLPGATTQVIFNDGGTNLAGDAGLVYNKTTDALTVAGLVTAGSAAITGDLTVDTSTLKVDSTNNRVGVGTATPAEKLDIYSSAGTAAIKLQTAANIPFTLNSQIPGVSNDGFAIRDGTASANRLTIDSSGNVNVVGGNLVIGTSGKGIDFSATASGSGTMTSELLADYEEGTWTPVLATDNVTFTSVGYIFQVGKYTKVGNLVTVTGTIQTNSVVIGSAAGNVWITGLPFTQPSTDAPGGVNCFVAQSWAVDAPLAGYVYDSKIYLVERATSVSSSSLVSVADVATGGSNNLVRFSGHYYV